VCVCVCVYVHMFTCSPPVMLAFNHVFSLLIQSEIDQRSIPLVEESITLHTASVAGAD